MQFRHTIVFAVAAMFMAVSCITVDKSLGDDFISTNQNLPVYSVELDIPVQVKSASPLQGISAESSIFGAIRTEEFGLAQFSTVADICPNISGWDFGKDPVVKEVYFLAPVTSTYVAQDNQTGIPQSLTLHRTNRRIDTTTVFNNSFTEADYDPVPLNVSENMYFGGDSIKIHLKKSFAEEILTSTQEQRDSLNLFAEHFKGLILKSSVPEDGIYGGRTNVMSYGAGAIYIRVDYQPTWDEDLPRKDTIFTLSWGFNYCLNVSEYESGKLQSENPQETLPYEGIAGLKPYISHSEMKALIDNWKAKEGYLGKHVLISKGTLIFPFEIPEDLDMTKYPTNIYPCNRVNDTTYNAKLFTTLEDCYVEGYNIGTQNRSLCEYAMDIPSYIQEMVRKDASEIDDSYDLWLMPILAQTSSDSYSGSSTTTYAMDFSNYYTGKLNGPGAERKPKLLLVYSVMEE